MQTSPLLPATTDTPARCTQHDAAPLPLQQNFQDTLRPPLQQNVALSSTPATATPPRASPCRDTTKGGGVGGGSLEQIPSCAGAHTHVSRTSSSTATSAATSTATTAATNAATTVGPTSTLEYAMKVKSHICMCIYVCIDVCLRKNIYM